MAIKLIRDAEREIEEWRPGVRTLMYASAATGAGQLTIFEQWCDSGAGAPTHTHAVEEVLRVLSGQARIWVGAESVDAGPGESVIIAPGAPHGFENTGDDRLHTQAILAAPIFEAEYLDPPRASRRWIPD